MRKYLTGTVLVTFLAAVMAGQGAAQLSNDDIDNSTINVSIASKVAVDIHPRQLDYSGSSVGAQDKSSDEGFEAIDIENTGSEYIDRIWANSTQLTDGLAQFGSGQESDFNAGNFFQIKPDNSSGLLEGDTSAYNFVNRRDYATYNDSLIPSYIEAPASGTYETETGTQSPSDVAVGRFRMGQNEYFFAIPTDKGCDGDGTFNTLLVGKEPHNTTSTAPIDFTTSNGFDHIPGQDYYKYNISSGDSGTSYGVVREGEDPGPKGVSLDNPVTGETRTYDVLLECDTNGAGSSPEPALDRPHTIRSRYNPEAANSNDLFSDPNAPATDYLLKADNTKAEQLSPGESVTINTAIEVPRGIPQGIVNQGELSIVVQSDNGST